MSRYRKGNQYSEFEPIGLNGGMGCVRGEAVEIPVFGCAGAVQCLKIPFILEI